MPNELTREHARLLYDLATNSQRTGNLVHAIQVMEKLVEINEPFYTPFALAVQSQCYNALGRRDLETHTLKRIIRLPEEQQQLLNPGYLATCYQRSGDLKRAKEINAELLDLTPYDPTVIAALAELSLLGDNSGDATRWATNLRDRPEPGYQILARMISALVLLRSHMAGEAAKELQWVGQFLISTGNIPFQVWDYRDLEPLAVDLIRAPGLGIIPTVVRALFDALTGKLPLPQFTEAWNKITAAESQPDNRSPIDKMLGGT